MKKSFKRLASMLTALSLCASLAVSAAAIPTTEELEQAVSSIQLNATANQLSDGSYQVQYKADLTMSDIFAQAVSALNTGDYLKNLQFTCILEDDLVKQLSLADVSFTFAGPGAANFIPDGENYVSKGPNGELMIRYLLDPEKIDEWPYIPAAELPAILMQQMTMTSTQKTVSASQFDQAKDADGKLLTSARVEISYKGGNIPIYDEEMILAAESREVKMDIDEYTAPDKDKDKPVYDIEVNRPQSTPESAPTPDPDTQPVLPTPKPEATEKGKVEVSHNQTYAGNKVTITEVVEEGYRVTNITVVDDDGNNIPVTRNGNGTYTFEMPAEHVTVTPSFDLASTHDHDFNDTFTQEFWSDN